MSHQIRRVATVMLVLFGVLFINLNVIQLLRGEDLVNNPANRRLLEREYEIERGEILVGEDEIVRSEETDGELKYLRRYLEPETYAHLTGFYSFVLGRAGLERALNEILTGTSTAALAENLTELLIGRDEEGNTVRLTIDAAVQQAARDALGGREGAVVALDPRSGAVLASYSNPSYDPNALSSHDANAILDAWGGLQDDPAQPLLDRVTRGYYPPGSTFKLVDAAAALEQGLQPSTALENRASYTPPGTSTPIPNFSPGPCGDGGPTITLQQALAVSCNTVFAELGVKLGQDVLGDMATRLGFNRQIPYALPVEVSNFPGDLDDPALAQSAIGQRDVRWTPMHAALVVSAIVNDGTMVAPHVVAEVLDPASRTLRDAQQQLWRGDDGDARAMSQRTAEQMREMMASVVEGGTGTRAAIDGVRVGGKTGTAENPADDSATAWFVGFAEDQVAVAVVLPDAGGEGGGTAAAPIARAVMQAALS
jgi:peptidoglycan glycosyltransferase